MKRIPRPTKPVDRPTAYARDVVAGRLVAGRLVKLACQRHLDDLKNGHKRGLVYDPAAAQFTIDFFESILCLNGGEHEGKPFNLSPWQAFLLGMVFGWKLADGSRRFRTAYVEIAKGNGKSPLAAGIGLKCEVADGEPRAEIYAAATKRDQAMILFRDAVAMVHLSPSLEKIIETTGGKGREFNLAHHASNSFFRPIASDDHSQSGPRPHCALIDEIHEHRSAAVIDMMHAGKKGRRQPLIFEITNSGSDRASICWQHHKYSVQILEGNVLDDSWFAFVCGLDPCIAHRAEGQDQPVDGCPACDDWRNESVWLKANPNLGVSVTLRYLRDQVTMARGMPAFENEVKRLNFCIWTQASSRAIPEDRWKACARELKIETFAGRECCAALDIGSTSDFTAFVLLFPHDDAEIVEVKDPTSNNPEASTQLLVRRSYTVFPFFWLPESPVKRDEHTSRIIDAWRNQGLIRTTPGNCVDYAQVLLDIEQILVPFTLLGLAIDRGFQGNWIASRLVDLYGELIETPSQGILTMNAPFRELLELIKTGRLHHPNHPVLNWMAGNTVAEERSGLIKFSKDHSSEKIDGIASLTMAIFSGMKAPAEGASSGGVEAW